MSDAEQSAPPVKRPQLETAQEAYEVACTKHSSCKEHLHKLQAELLQEMRNDPSSKVVSTLEKDKEQASNAVDRAWETLQYEREQAKQSEAHVVKKCC